MMQVKRWFICTASVLAVSMLCSCASYTPDQSSIQKMSVDDAMKNIQDMVLYHARMIGESRHFEPVSTIRITPSRIKIYLSGGAVVKARLRELQPDAGCDALICLIDLGIKRFDGVQNAVKIDRNTEAVYHITDALLKLKQLAVSGSSPENDARFAETVRIYRAAIPKPPLSEECRRFKVQAESAIRDKNFDDAADFYEEALEVAPWWPEGHFNRAIVLGETKEYDLAIIEMKRYLALAPNAPDARAAQDKIYDWERKTGVPN
jgi:tetratricopeptide (TPR) repeat protein